MTAFSTLLPLALAAVIDVPAGAPLGEALARAHPGDVVRLGPGVHAGAQFFVLQCSITGHG